MMADYMEAARRSAQIRRERIVEIPEADRSFSYRWVESGALQNHETVFLAKIDSVPHPIQEIQYWLYEKAKEYGYMIDPKKPFDKDCVNYRKEAKQFILAGEREFMEFGFQHRMFTKVIFREVFSKRRIRCPRCRKKARCIERRLCELYKVQWNKRSR